MAQAGGLPGSMGRREEPELKLMKWWYRSTALAGPLVFALLMLGWPGTVGSIVSQHQAHIEVLIPGGASLIQALNTGSFDCAVSNCSLIIGTDGSCSPGTGSQTSCAGGHNEAVFRVLGANGALYTITLPSTVTADLVPGGGSSIQIDSLTGFSENLNLGGTDGQTGGDGTDTFSVGGTAQFQDTTPSGTYVASFTITVVFS